MKTESVDRPNRRLKLLVAIASYGTGGDKYLARLIEEYQGMSFDVRIVVVSNIEKRLPKGVELKVGLPARNPWSLPFAHKKVLAEQVNDHDLFIYSEDDTLVTQKNIEAFLEVSEVLPETEIPGFLRYEVSPNGVRNYISLHGHYHWDPASVCQRGPYMFAFHTNEHSACYLLTRKQLQHAIDTGHYLVPPYQGKYDLACTASTDPYTACGFRKLICISRLDDFLVHHLPDKYTSPEFSPSEQAFDKQVQALMTIGKGAKKPAPLVETETALPAAMYSKQYDEAPRERAFGEIPSSVRRVLSIGSGWGKSEKWLQEHGMQVTALPLDPVIGACLKDSGVELLCGDFSTARTMLAGRRFDCLFLSNILHLAPSPEKILREYADLLEPGGSVVLLTCNVATLKTRLYGFLGKPGYRELRDFSRGGVQFVSLRTVKKWFATAGLAVEKIKWNATPRFESVVRFAPGLFGPMFGSEIVAIGKKISGKQDAPRSARVQKSEAAEPLVYETSETPLTTRSKNVAVLKSPSSVSIG
jgi:2-polyprenyl-3-methyl-5-hydroxy-6-metoxy-1,4-benzoquinol methylase